MLLMNGVGNFILRRLGFRPVAGEEMVHSVEELVLLIEDTEEAGILDPDQADFVQNVFRLSNKRVGDCMVPRDKMAALELNTPPEKVLEAVRSRRAHAHAGLRGDRSTTSSASSTPRTCFICSACKAWWSCKTPCTRPCS